MANFDLQIQLFWDTVMGTSEGKSQIVDWDAAMETVGGDKDLLFILMDTFSDETPQLMAALRQAIDAQDFIEVQRNAHTIKGSLRVFGVVTHESEQAWKEACPTGLPEVTSGGEAAIALEMMGARKNLDGHERHFATLQEMLEQVEAEFRAKKSE